MRCSCGSGLPVAECCGPVLDGTRTAATAEQLMRSRYTAFALGDAAHLLATWHPRTRPAELGIDAGVRWTGLDVLATTGGSPLENQGTVEFRAHYVLVGRGVAGRTGAQHERSRFLREQGRWFYVDGVSLA